MTLSLLVLYLLAASLPSAQFALIRFDWTTKTKKKSHKTNVRSRLSAYITLLHQTIHLYAFTHTLNTIFFISISIYHHLNHKIYICSSLFICVFWIRFGSCQAKRNFVFQRWPKEKRDISGMLLPIEFERHSFIVLFSLDKNCQFQLKFRSTYNFVNQIYDSPLPLETNPRGNSSFIIFLSRML